MATRTLGVKFQVIGVEKAASSINELKQGINNSLKANRENVYLAEKLDKQTSSIAQNAKVLVKQKYSFDGDYVGNTAKTYQLIRQKQYGQAAINYARPRANAVNGGFFEGIGNAAGSRVFDRLDSIFAKLTGRKEYRETVELGNETISKIGLSVSRGIKGKSTDISQRDKNKGGSKVSFGQNNLVEKAIDRALMPIKTIQYSFFEGIGSNFGNQFAEGLSQVLDSDLDINFNRKGQVTGKAVSYTATEGVDKLKRNFGDANSNFNDLRYSVEDGRVDEIGEKFDKLVKSVSRTITSVADSYLTGFRKGSIKLEALRKVESEIAKKDVSGLPDLTGKKKVIYTVAGLAGKKGQQGKYMAEQLKPYVKEDTAVIGADNEFTDALAESDKNPFFWGISGLANIAKINLKGFNPDAVKLAAKVINTIATNPDIKVELLGHSAGGFVVEEAQEILSELGYKDRVKTRTAGTPQLIGGLNNPSVEPILGDNDLFIKLVEEGLESFGAGTPTENIAKGVKNHFFPSYLDSDDFREKALGDSLDKEKALTKKRSKSPFKGKLIELETLYQKYVSRIYQNLDELGEELSIAPDRLIAKSRRNKLRDRGGKELDRKLSDRDFREIELKEGTKTAVLVSGGFSGAKGRSGATFAKRLNGLKTDDSTEFIGVRNPFTDVLDKEDVRNPDAEKSIPKILKIFGDVHKKGYNPDAVEIAAQVMDLLAKDPNLKVKVAGYSGGGYVAEDVMELLKSKNVDMSRVDVMGIATPELPGGIKNKDFKKILGEKDPVMQAQQLKAYNNKLKEILGFDILPELMQKMQNVEGIKSHQLEEYVANSQEVQDFLYGHIPGSKELLGKYSKITNLNNQVDTLGKEMQAVDASKDLTRAEKVERLRAIRAEYIEVLKDIYPLAKTAQKLGGGKMFEKERNYAKEELESAGIEVEPVTETIKDPWEDAAEDEAQVIQNRSKKLALEYKEYLESLDKKAKSKKTAGTISQDFLALDKQSQKNYLQRVKTVFNAKAKYFRQAVKSGQLEVARKQGEELIVLAATIKKLYKNIDSNPNIDPSVKASLKGYSGYATAVKNEVIGGSKAKGRVAEGLPQQFEAQVNLAEEDGENVVRGFIDGIVSQLVEARLAGEEIVEATEEGIRKKGEIKSPSRLAKRLGSWFAKGFGLGVVAENLEDKGREVVEQVEKGIKDRAKKNVVGGARNLYERGKSSLNNARENAPEKREELQEITGNVSEEVEGLKDDVATEFEEELLGLEDFIGEHQDKFLADNIERFLDAAGAGIIKKIGQLVFNASGSEDFDKITTTIVDLVGKIAKLALAFSLLKIAADAFGLNKLIEGFSGLPEAALDAANAVEVLDNRIIDISQSSIEGAKNLNFIRKTAKELEKDLSSAKENYAELLGATQFNSLKGVQTENIYTAFAGVSKKKGFSKAQEERLFKSIRSMIGKEILSQEEVRQEIAELLPDFPQALAASQGVQVPQLNAMIESRQMVASDALPKVAQYYMAQGAIADSANTGAAAVNRLDNAITRFRESVGFVLQPIQKFGNNFLAGFFNKLADGVESVQSLIRAFFALLFFSIVKFQIFGQSIQKLLLLIIKLIWTAKGALAAFALQLVALTLIIATVNNTWKLLHNSFPQAQKNIKSLTLGIEKLGQAYLDAAEGGKKLNRNLPRSGKDLNLAEGWQVPEWLQGVAGGTHLNINNLVTKRLNSVLERTGKTKTSQVLTKSVIGSIPFLAPFAPVGGLKRLTTQAERKQGDFVNNSDDLLFKTNAIFNQRRLGNKAVTGIQDKDAQIRNIQSERLTLLPGDREGLEKSLAKESEILQERDKLLKVTSQYQQNLDLSIKALKQQLEELDKLILSDGIVNAVEEDRRAQLTSRLDDFKKEKTRFDKSQSKLTNSLSGYDRELRNVTERMAGFNENRDRLTSAEKTNIIERGIDREKGDRTIEIELDDLSRRDLKARLNNLDKQISKLEQNLKSPALAPGAERVKSQLKQQGIPLNDASLQRIVETTPVANDRDAAKQLLEKRKLEREKTQYSEQLAQNLQNNRNVMRDFNRTIDDYFFNLTQRIKEAQLEVKTLITKVFATNIKTKLRQALAPGSESFVNGIVNGIQSILDQAQSLIERELGIEGSQIQLETEAHSLEREMQDFIRGVNGATDSLSRFSQATLRAFHAPRNAPDPSGNALTSDPALRSRVADRRKGMLKLPSNGAKASVRFNRERASLDGNNSSSSDVSSNGNLVSEGAEVAAEALSWEGKHFKKGVYAMCAGFVRQILNKSGVDVGVTKKPYDAGKQPNNGELMARSFFGNDIGTVFQDKNQAKPGDIIGFFDTYDYGQKPGAITHVGIYQGNEMMVDRSTSSAPVKNRSIDTFGKGNYIFVRPHEYEDRENYGNNNIETKARTLTDRYIKDKASAIELNQTLLRQENDLLNLQSEQQLATQQRQFDTQQREGLKQQFSLSDRFADFADRGKLATAEVEYQRTLRQTAQQFRDLNSELNNQEIRYSDTVNSLQKFIAEAPEAIALLRASGQNERADFLAESLTQFQNALPAYQELLTNLDRFQGQLPELQKQINTELERQGKLKIEAETITKRTATQQLKTTIATQRGTNELRRQNEIASERLRLEQQINQIKLKYGDTDYSRQLIQLERQNSLVKEQGIDRAAVDRERQYERQLLDLDSGINNGRADRLIQFGHKFKGNKIKRETAVASENFRYQQQLAEIEKNYAGDSEKIDILKRKAEELNRVNLANIQQQFKSLGQTLLEMSQNNLTSFFENSFAAFSNDGQKEVQLLQAQLQYKEELLALEEKYRDNPDGLSFAKDRVKELNEEKLDKIKQEFDIFNRVVDSARQALISLLKEIAKMAAVKAAASIISSIIGGAAGSAVGGGGTSSSLNFDGGSGAFTAELGATVPSEGRGQMAVGRRGLIGNFKKGGRIVPSAISDRLQKISRPIKSAFKKEGSKGVLGVFTPGEEILSIKTGEAGRYQALKKRYGTEPLEKIFAGNFVAGGTIGTPNIESNLLRSLDFKTPSINVRAVGETPKQSTVTNNITNFSASIVTPDADSFRESGYQRQQDFAEALLRGVS